MSISTRLNRRRRYLALAAALVVTGALAAGTGGTAVAAQAPVGLKTATTFAVLAGSTVTNAGTSTISGNVGVSPGTKVTGFSPTTVSNGSIHAADGVALQAKSDLTDAYNDAASRPLSATVTADLGGQTLVSGVYRGSDLSLTGPLTLDAKGDPNAVFVFQAGSTLITASNSSVILLNGADACNVIWQVGSSATLGTNSVFVGSVLALTSISAKTGAIVSGRLLARNGAVTLDSNTITRPGCMTAPPSSTTTPASSSVPATTAPATTAPATTAPATTAPATTAPATTAPATTAPATTAPPPAPGPAITTPPTTAPATTAPATTAPATTAPATTAPATTSPATSTPATTTPGTTTPATTSPATSTPATTTPDTTTPDTTTPDTTVPATSTPDMPIAPGGPRETTTTSDLTTDSVLGVSTTTGTRTSTTRPGTATSAPGKTTASVPRKTTASTPGKTTTQTTTTLARTGSPVSRMATFGFLILLAGGALMLARDASPRTR